MVCTLKSLSTHINSIIVYLSQCSGQLGNQGGFPFHPQLIVFHKIRILLTATCLVEGIADI